jgi:hypothetical protein
MVTNNNNKNFLPVISKTLMILNTISLLFTVSEKIEKHMDKYDDIAQYTKYKRWHNSIFPVFLHLKSNRSSRNKKKNKSSSVLQEALEPISHVSSEDSLSPATSGF